VPRTPGASAFAAESRRHAAAILSRPPYTQKPARYPDPLAGVFRAVGRAFVWALGHPARWLWRHTLFPGFHFTFAALSAGGWIVALALALGLGVLVGVVLVHRRSRKAARPSDDRPEPRGKGHIDLEPAAEAAEAAGNNELAVRLRFQLGLAKLEARGRIPDRLTMTSHQLRSLLRSTVFDDLASRHESITYAQEQASASDVASARDGWGRLLAETATTSQENPEVPEPAGSPR
jgi:hypothetical protein